MPTVATTPDDERFRWLSSAPFIVIHLVPLAAFWTGVTLFDVALCLFLYFARMFFITAGYHRYFAHRTYRLSRWMQFLFAFGGGTAAQKGPLWWASHHRRHHRYSDQERDVHSPKKGFWWSHVLWITCKKFDATDYDAIRDFSRYPELVFLNRQHWLPPTILAIGCYALGGWSALVVGFFLSTVLLYHGTFTINSLAHTFGRRRYATSDTSRNSLILSLITLGEGWHNNHHHYPSSVNQGFFWWEIDVSYYVLLGLRSIGLARDLKHPPRRTIEANRIGDGHADVGMGAAAELSLG